VRSGDLAGQLVAGKLDFVWARAQAIYDRPTKVEGKARREAHIRPQLRPLFEAVRSDVFFVSPYFVPGEAGVVQLRELRNRGVSVRVLTNSLAGTDVPAVYAGYSNYRVPLLDAGVELFELRPVGGSRSGQEALTEALGASRATLHAKTFVVDRRYVFVGSMNLDARSDLINTEFGLLIDSEAIAEQLLAQLARLCAPSHSYRVVRTGAGVEWITEEEGRELRTRRTPDVSPWRRIQAVVLSVLAPEELL
jgi:putative cardiolipin synthase